MATLGDLLEQKRREDLAAHEQLSQGLQQGSTKATAQATDIAQNEGKNALQPLNMLAGGAAGFFTGGPIGAALGAISAPRGGEDILGSGVKGAATGVTSKGIDMSNLATPTGLQSLSATGSTMLGTPEEAVKTLGTYATTQVAKEGAKKLSSLYDKLRPLETAGSLQEATDNINKIKTIDTTLKDDLSLLTPDQLKDYQKVRSEVANKAQTTFNSLTHQKQVDERIDATEKAAQKREKDAQKKADEKEKTKEENLNKVTKVQAENIFQNQLNNSLIVDPTLVDNTSFIMDEMAGKSPMIQDYVRKPAPAPKKKGLLEKGEELLGIGKKKKKTSNLSGKQQALSLMD